MAKKEPKFRGIENKPMFMAHAARAASGAAGQHGVRVNPKAQISANRENTRLARTRRAISDQLG